MAIRPQCRDNRFEIQRIVDADRKWEFPFDERWQKLYDVLVGIQTGTEDDPFGWRYDISV